MRRLFALLVFLSCALCTLSISGQTADVAKAAAPRLVKFSGKVPNAHGVVGVTFAFYKDQDGGSPLWLETQNVQTDAQGRYTVLLGSNKSDGLPVELFASGEARWVGAQPEGGVEQPRVLLVSVPYALKAVDADTVGGLPVSAFVLAASSPSIFTTPTGTNPLIPSLVASGTANSLAKFTNSTDLGNSIMYESAGKIGVNNTAPWGTFHVTSPVSRIMVDSTQVDANAGFWMQALGPNGFVRRGGMYFKVGNDAASTYFGLSGDDLTYHMIVSASGNVGIGTTSPTQKLSVTGVVESIAGGFKFPDGTTQTTAGLTSLSGSGLSVTNLNASNLTTGTVPSSVVSGTYSNAVVMSNNSNFFVGNGAGLANVNASLLGGQPIAAFGNIAALRTRGINYIAGCDSCSVLNDNDDGRSIYINVVGTMTIQAITCFSDAGTPTINIQRDDGTPANVLSTDLMCSPAGSTSSAFNGAENVMNVNDKLDFVIVTAGGTARRVTVAIKALIN